MTRNTTQPLSAPRLRCQTWLLALLLACGSILASDLKLEAQLIWGTNEPKSPNPQARSVRVNGANVSGVNVSLVNGDIDGDNEVTLMDFGAVVAAFGSVPGDSNWNPEADLDGDAEVTLLDFGVLVKNFGETGEE